MKFHETFDLLKSGHYIRRDGRTDKSTYLRLNDEGILVEGLDMVFPLDVVDLTSDDWTIVDLDSPVEILSRLLDVTFDDVLEVMMTSGTLATNLGLDVKKNEELRALCEEFLDKLKGRKNRRNTIKDKEKEI